MGYGLSEKMCCWMLYYNTLSLDPCSNKRLCDAFSSIFLLPRLIKLQLYLFYIKNKMYEMEISS